MTPDMINGCIEAVGAGFVANHCRVALLHREIRGVSLASVTFSTGWSLWGLVYYPGLEQWYSFAGCILMASASVAWWALNIRYRR